MKIFSSGGVGDALIVGMKIENLRVWTKAKIQYWQHREKHECHGHACNDIVKHFVPKGKFILSENPEKESKEIEAIGNDQFKNSCKYIDTKIIEFPHPYLPNQIENNYHLSTELWDKENYICVQMTAGRLHDNTKRHINFSVIYQLHEKFPNKTIVMLGPELIPYETNFLGNVINLTGKTPSILDAFSCINNCGLFVGQDGVMAYYSMMLRKNTIINYHLPNLINHYWNNHWSLHGLAVCGAGNNLNKFPPGIDKFLNNAEKNMC